MIDRGVSDFARGCEKKRQDKSEKTFAEMVRDALEEKVKYLRKYREELISQLLRDGWEPYGVKENISMAEAHFKLGYLKLVVYQEYAEMENMRGNSPFPVAPLGYFNQYVLPKYIMRIRKEVLDMLGLRGVADGGNLERDDLPSEELISQLLRDGLEPY